MVLIKKIHNRGANIVVEAHGEVLFAGTGDVGKWTRELVKAIEVGTKAAAPRNKRPRWAHYGKPLRSTFQSDVAFRPNQMKVYGAVGSSSEHALYPDQGTGVYAGGSAYEAKILPPWRRGSPSLYEHTWVPPGSNSRVAPVMIQGQRGQFFFDAGLRHGFAAMRMLSFEAPSNPKIEDAVRSLPAGVLAFLDQGNTGANPAFVAQLQQWRQWRDQAFNEGRTLGRRKGRVNSRPTRKRTKRTTRRRTSEDLRHQREMSAARSQRYRDRERAKRKTTESSAVERRVKAETKVSRILRQRGYTVRELVLKPDGTWTARVKGPRDRNFRQANGKW